ncbi:hypothetical protein EV13_2112 [Prochlorococcus sp. MIT 0702]|nr:hypothetical protein EV13_2112 [Prochlorococcus sp. MIT 0702]KGG27697.1 hypothetical protein EV12_1127 [Prochlorococcus sp. MIT 0701]KGG31936.1 hypothetical protein EV14_2144 [Prochlorococcus sp. MIT 0703]
MPGFVSGLQLRIFILFDSLRLYLSTGSFRVLKVWSFVYLFRNVQDGFVAS